MLSGEAAHRSQPLLSSPASQLQLVADHAPVYLAHCDREGRYKFVNRGYAERFGLTPADVIGMRIPDVVGEEAYAVFRPHVERTLAGERVEFEVEIPYERLGPRIMRCAYAPEVRPDGTVAGLIAAISDITDRRRAERTLRQREQHLRAVIDTTPECVKVVEPDGTLVEMNAAGLTMVEAARPDEVLGRCVFDVVAPEHRDAFIRMHERVCAGEAATLEFEIIGLRGTRRIMETHAVPLRNAGGAFSQLAITRDITARKAAEAALAESARQKDEFLAILAHELRNPLAPLRTALDLMRLAPEDRAVREKAEAVMERQITQLVRLVDDLLDVSRITRGKIDLRRQRLRLDAVIQSAVETSRPFIEACGHTLTVELPPDTAYVDADPTRLAQVFSNLLNNAAKYTRRGGVVALRWAVTNGRVVVSVRDTGIGIPPEMLSRIFEMFTQVHRTAEKTHEGLGIGLTLAKRLVEMHGGTIEARSAGPDHGSEFLVSLPLAPAPSVDDVAPRRTLRSQAPARRILLVDDNRDALESLAMALEMAGHVVRTAHDGFEAIDAADQFRPEIVLLDIGMPRLNGHEAGRRIRARLGSECPVLVALTGWGQEDDRRKSREAGFDHHLVKPVDPELLDSFLATLTLPGGSSSR